MEKLDLRVDLSKEALIKFYKQKIKKARKVKKAIDESDMHIRDRITRKFELDTIISQFKYLIKMTNEHFKDKGE